MSATSPPPAKLSPRRRRNRLLARLILLGVSVIVALLLAEIGARVYAKLTLRARAVDFDPELGWRLLPNVKKVGSMWGREHPATTNSRGWRDAEHPYEKPAGVKRIVAIGDSMTFGMGVDDGERFTELLEKRFDKLEVINLGVTGYGTDQELLVLEKEGFRYDPDMVVLIVCLCNDHLDIRYEYWQAMPKPYFTLDAGELKYHAPQQTLGTRARRWSYLWEYVSQRFRDDDRDARKAPEWQNTDALPLFAALVGRMNADCAKRKLPFLVVLAHEAKRLETGQAEHAARIRDLLNEAGIPFLDNYDLFAAQAKTGKDLFVVDRIHWSPFGHELIANEIDLAIRDKGWLK